jgi:diguanylate cyclase (GGDEF)-like protein
MDPREVVMSDDRTSQAIDTLTLLAKELTLRPSFEDTLQAVVERAVDLVGVSRASIRILDPTRTQLIAVARTGERLHDEVQEFQVGEGLIGWIAEHGKPLRTGDAPSDPRFDPRPGRSEKLRSVLGVPLLSGERCVGVLSAASSQPHYFTADHERLFALVAAIAAPWVEVARLTRISRFDPLTGILNRRGLDETHGAGGPNGNALTVVMVDLDHFKRVNDEHGHPAGDQVLRVVAERLAESVRAGDAVVRYGGEEFLLVLPGSRLENGRAVAERARRALCERPIEIPGATLTVTGSFGVAERRGEEDRDALVGRADTALYAAKEAGRNRVEVAE